MLVNKERKTEIKEEDVETQRDRNFHHHFKKTRCRDWHNNEKLKSRKGSNSPLEHCKSGGSENLS